MPAGLRILLYTAGILAAVALYGAWDGSLFNGTMRDKVLAILLAPVAGFLIWLRWDWARRKDRERREVKAGPRARLDTAEQSGDA